MGERAGENLEKISTETLVAAARAEIENFREKFGAASVVVIRGATATGKTKLAVELAEFLPVEVVSADSRQIFTKMDIGTDKVSAEIRAKIPHWLIDVVEPDETFTAGQRKNAAEQKIEEILGRGKIPVVAGGTGLYLDLLYKNFSMPEVAPNLELRKTFWEKEAENPGWMRAELNRVDPAEAAKIHPKSLRFLVRALEIREETGVRKSEGFQENPPRWPLLMLGLWRGKEETNRRINARIREMIAGGLAAEVQGLLDAGFGPELQAMQGIGYKETVEFLRGEIGTEKWEEILKRRTQQLAKKQRTRFRRYIADGRVGGQERVVHRVWGLE